MRPLALALALAWLPTAAADPAPPGTYAQEIEAWRAARESRLRADGGWLTVAGLFWLEPGSTSFGSAGDDAVRLPAPAPAHAGRLELEAGHVRYVLAEGVQATLDGATAPRRGELRHDHEGEPNVLGFGPVSFYLIRRGERLGVRVKNQENPARREFAGLAWYPVGEAWRVTGRFVPHPTAQTLTVPNVLGQVEEMPSPGYVVFELGGRELRLDPVLEGPDAEELFFIFRDATSGRTTYPGGRFLYAPREKDGRVTLDFNKAYSPPCAFTPWATCPLPPKQNRLDVPVEAGERHSGRH